MAIACCDDSAEILSTIRLTSWAPSTEIFKASAAESTASIPACTASVFFSINSAVSFDAPVVLDAKSSHFSCHDREPLPCIACSGRLHCSIQRENVCLECNVLYLFYNPCDLFLNSFELPLMLFNSISIWSLLFTKSCSHLVCQQTRLVCIFLHFPLHCR